MYKAELTVVQVQIRADNVNDESPHFIPTAHYVGYVAEDAQGNTPIVTVQVHFSQCLQKRSPHIVAGGRSRS